MDVFLIRLAILLSVFTAILSLPLLGAGGLLGGNSGNTRGGQAKAYSGLGYGGGSAQAPDGAASADAYGQGRAQGPGTTGEGSGYAEGNGYTSSGDRANAYAKGYGKEIGVGQLADVGYGMGEAGYETSNGQMDTARSTTLGTRAHLPTGDVELAPTIEDK